MSRPVSVWTDDRKALVRRLREKGLATKTIAAQLGVTKNSICGVLGRMRPAKLGRQHKAPHRNKSQIESRRQRRERLRAERDAAAWLAVPIPSWVPHQLSDDYRDLTTKYGEEQAASTIRARKRTMQALP